MIADTLRRQTDLTDDAVEQLMRWAAEKTAPLEENESLRNIAEAYVKVTRKEVANVLGQLAAADVDGRVYPIKDVYRRTMDYVFRRSPAAQRRRRRLCGVPRCACGSGASHRRPLGRAHFFRGVHGPARHYGEDGRNDHGHQREASRRRRVRRLGDQRAQRQRAGP